MVGARTYNACFAPVCAPAVPATSNLAQDCKLVAQDLTIILTPTQSLSGTTQVVSRVLEVALHKTHTLGFDLNDVVEGVASAPLPSPGKDFTEAMGRTNDAILYGGTVHLWVKGKDTNSKKLAEELSSKNSGDYGESFSKIFKNVNYDFYKIDPHLFAPFIVVAKVTVHAELDRRIIRAARLGIDVVRPIGRVAGARPPGWRCS